MEHFICKYCKSIRKNANSKRQHETRCKENPKRIAVVSNFIEYNRKLRVGDLFKEHSNQYVKAKKLGLPKPEISDLTRKKLSEGRKFLWTEEARQIKSATMKRVVLENPESYSASNVCGRTKITEYKGFKLNGSWELEVAKWLDVLEINWTNKIAIPFEYEWQGGLHLYFPDFYLPEKDLYIEVKGYERDRDRCKWSVVSNLLVLKAKEIQLIQKGLYRL